MKGTTHRMGQSTPDRDPVAVAAVVAIRATNPDWPGAEVRTAVAAILRASMPASDDVAAAS
jgi:hypothetical protein